MKDITIATVVSCSPVGKLTDNLSRMKQWVSAASRQDVNIVCFPELNLTGYSTQPDFIKHALSIEDEIITQLETLAKQENIFILTGMIEKGEDNKCYASHLVLGPSGLQGVYRKLHIAPPEKETFFPGQDIPVFDIPGCKFGLQLCYDAHFPELTAKMALLDADIIFIPHASPRGTSQEKYKSWMRHLPARAYDNSVYVVAWNQIGENGQGLTFPGLSMVIGPSGKVIETHLYEEENMMIATLKADELNRIRKNRMHFFLPHRRSDLY